MNLELLILEGPQAGRRLPIGIGATTFGRSTNAEVSFPFDNFISGTHLSVQADPVGVLVTDLHSTNGTFLNGQRISKAVADVGDEIKIGSLTMKVVAAQQQAEPPVFSSPFQPVPAPIADLPPAESAVKTVALPPTLPPMEIPAPPPVQAVANATTILQAIQLPVPLVPPPPSAPPVDPVPVLLRTLRELPEPLFCLLNAAESKTLPITLALSGVELVTHSLLEGYTSAQLPDWSPYLLPLERDSELLPMLVKEGWGKGWCCFFTSSAPFEDLRTHFSKFLMVQVGKGGDVYFRFYDPRVLRGFLPVASVNERTVFFGPVTEWLLEADDPNMLLRARNSPEGLISSTKPIQ